MPEPAPEDGAGSGSAVGESSIETAAPPSHLRAHGAAARGVVVLTISVPAAGRDRGRRQGRAPAGRPSRSTIAARQDPRPRQGQLPRRDARHPAAAARPLVAALRGAGQRVTFAPAAAADLPAPRARPSRTPRLRLATPSSPNLLQLDTDLHRSGSGRPQGSPNDAGRLPRPPLPSGGSLQIGNVEIRPAELQVLVDGRRTGFTVREFELFFLLAEAPRQRRPAARDLRADVGRRDAAPRPLGRRARPQGPRQARDGRPGVALHPHPLRHRLPLHPRSELAQAHRLTRSVGKRASIRRFSRGRAAADGGGAGTATDRGAADRGDQDQGRAGRAARSSLRSPCFVAREGLRLLDRRLLFALSLRPGRSAPGRRRAAAGAPPAAAAAGTAAGTAPRRPGGERDEGGGVTGGGGDDVDGGLGGRRRRRGGGRRRRRREARPGSGCRRAGGRRRRGRRRRRRRSSRLKRSGRSGRVPQGRCTLPAWTVTGCGVGEAAGADRDRRRAGVERAEQAGGVVGDDLVARRRGRACAGWSRLGSWRDEVGDVGVRGGEAVLGRDPRRRSRRPGTGRAGTRCRGRRRRGWGCRRRPRPCPSGRRRSGRRPRPLNSAGRRAAQQRAVDRLQREVLDHRDQPHARPARGWSPGRVGRRRPRAAASRRRRRASRPTSLPTTPESCER